MTQDLIARRCVAQLLSGPPARSALEVVRRLLAVQGQDQRGARLAVRARSAGLTAADVDRALTDDRSLLITWLNRGTLHLVTSEDYWWLQALTTPQVTTAVRRRLAEEGVPPADAETAVGVIDTALGADGPLTRDQLAERVAAAGVRTHGQAMPHILYEASLRGLIIRGPMAGRQHAFVRVADWLGPPPDRFLPERFDRDAALAELARRFLAGHGPASDRDLAKWAGLPLRDARRGLAAISGELADRDDGLAVLALGRGPDQGEPGAGLPPPRLLGSFDPLLHGWVNREPVLGGRQGVVTLNGVFRPFALAGGRAVATWTLTSGKVRLAPFEPLAKPVADALDADAGDVVRFLG
ncbi:MAG TPA: winged helix DNA-binding domain-containing protein [Streptosporangiaceae bacterium]